MNSGNTKLIKEIKKWRKIMKYKLIATDMDGTLLNDEHLISEGNIEAIKEIQKKGVKFVLASGRPSFAMFDWDDIRKIYELSCEIEIPMALYGEDTVYASKDTENTRFEAKLCGMKFREFGSLEELDGYGIKETTKCMLISDPEKVKKAEEHMKSKYGNEYFIAISKPIFLEIANKNINKGKTLRQLGELTGIGME